MFALLPIATATHLLPAHRPALQGHARDLGHVRNLWEGSVLSEGRDSSLFLRDSSALRPEGQT